LENKFLSEASAAAEAQRVQIAHVQERIAFLEDMLVIAAEKSKLTPVTSSTARPSPGPDIAHAWVRMGRGLFHAGQPEHASVAWARAAEIASSSPSAAAELVEYLCEAQLFEEAERFVTEKAGADALLASGTALAAALIDACRWNQAEGLTINLRRSRSESHELALLEAFLAARLGQLDAAITAARRIIEASPQNLMAHQYALHLSWVRSQGHKAARLEEAPAVKFYAVGGKQIVLPHDHPLENYQSHWRRYDLVLADITRVVSQKYASLAVIDIGANVGDSAALIRRDVPCPVLCIEGHPSFLPFLHHNAALLGENVFVEDSFVGTETVLEYVEASNGTASLVSSAATAASAKAGRTFHATTLATILQKHPQFAGSKLLKIDTDGFDFPIIVAAADFLQQMRPIVYFEYDPSFSPDDSSESEEALEILFTAGYVHFLVFDNFGNPLARIEGPDRLRFAELNAFLKSNRENGVATYYLDVCAIHRDDDDLIYPLSGAVGFPLPN
jgi:FkbM family methyltransferase